MAMCKKESTKVPPLATPPAADTELSRGLPQNPDSIHGYFFSTYNYYRNIANDTYTIANCYAQFCDPASNLLVSVNRDNQLNYPTIKSNSNVDMGNVRFNRFYLTSDRNFQNSNLFHYQLNSYDHPDFDQRVSWSVQGNEIVSSFEQRLKDEFPLPKALDMWLGLDCKKDYTVHPADYFDRWDSVVVQIKGEGYNGLKISARCGADSALAFSQKELAFFKSSSDSRLTVKAYRFFNRVIGGRFYVFELGTSVEYRLNIFR
jgi:hypothetical protein